MNKRLLSVLGFAFAVSLAASALIYRLVSAKLATAAKPGTHTVLVAAHDMKVGVVISRIDVKRVETAGPVPPHAVRAEGDAIGRGVVANIYQDEPILDTRLAAKGAGGGLAATIPLGMRAVAVRVNDVVGVAGFVLPGMRVDVLIAGNPPDGSPGTGMLSKTLLQNIEVLSAGTDIQKNTEGKPQQVNVVNLLVTPGQAEVLDLASSETRIQLVLRNPLDTREAKTQGTASSQLFDGIAGVVARRTAPQAVARPATARVGIRPRSTLAQPSIQPITVEVIQGMVKSQAVFQAEARR